MLYIQYKLVNQPKQEGDFLMKQDKKQQIVEAATKLLAEKGYEKASVKDIARESGITPGLVHYYFQNKEEILSEVVLQASNQYTHVMQALKQAVPAEQIGKAAMGEPRDRVRDQPDWYRLRYELFAIGLRNPSLADKVNHILDNGRNGITSILEQLMPESEETDAAAAILLACFDGFALQKLLNPNFDLDGAYLVLEKMVLSLKDTR